MLYIIDLPFQTQKHPNSVEKSQFSTKLLSLNFLDIRILPNGRNFLRGELLRKKTLTKEIASKKLSRKWQKKILDQIFLYIFEFHQCVLRIKTS